MPRLGPSVTGASGMQAFADPVHGLAVAHIGRAPLGRWSSHSSPPSYTDVRNWSPLA